MNNKQEEKIEVLVTAEELEDSRNAESFTKEQKVQAAIQRKVHDGVFEGLFPKEISTLSIVVDEMKFDPLAMGYMVQARIII